MHQPVQISIFFISGSFSRIQNFGNVCNKRTIHFEGFFYGRYFYIVKCDLIMVFFIFNVATFFVVTWWFGDTVKCGKNMQNWFFIMCEFDAMEFSTYFWEIKYYVVLKVFWFLEQWKLKQNLFQFHIL